MTTPAIPPPLNPLDELPDPAPFEAILDVLKELVAATVVEVAVGVDDGYIEEGLRLAARLHRATDVL